jgi:hypothetical protein
MKRLASSADIEDMREELACALPVCVRWLVVDTPVDFDFRRVERPLTLAGDVLDMSTCRAADEHANFYVFGSKDVADGGGASPLLGFDAKTGEVLGLDVERDGSPWYFLNSSVGQFILTFLAVDRTLRLGLAPVGALARELFIIDPAGYSRSEWRLLVEHVAAE